MTTNTDPKLARDTAKVLRDGANYWRQKGEQMKGSLGSPDKGLCMNANLVFHHEHEMTGAQSYSPLQKLARRAILQTEGVSYMDDGWDMSMVCKLNNQDSMTKERAIAIFDKAAQLLESEAEGHEQSLSG